MNHVSEMSLGGYKETQVWKQASANDLNPFTTLYNLKTLSHVQWH